MKGTFCIVMLMLLAPPAGAQIDLTQLLEHGTFEEQTNPNPNVTTPEMNGNSATPAMAGNGSAGAALLANRIFGIESLTNTIEKALAVAATFPEDSADLKKMLLQVPMRQDREIWLKQHSALDHLIQQQVDFIVGLQKAELKALQAEVGTQTAQQALQSPNAWEKVKDLQEPELEKVLPTLVPDTILTSLLQQRSTAETALAQQQAALFGEANPQLAAQKAELSAINQQISDRISGIMEALKIQYAISPHSETDNEEDQEIVRLQEMIDDSPDLINAPGDDRPAPLADAAAKGQLKVAVFLLDHGAEVNAGGRGGPPLVAAAKAGQMTMVELLLEHGADVNIGSGAALDAAIEHGYETVAETLLKAYADVNVENNSGETPLMLAAKGGKTNFIQMLLNAGANPNIADNDGVTALSRAALVNFPAALTPLKLLLAANADPNGGGCNAPLLCAINNRNTKAAELLLQGGANPNLKGLINGSLRNLNRDGNNDTTPLWAAVTMNDALMVQLLLNYKADPNSSQINNTPVIFKALDKTTILQALLAAGANPNIMNQDGRTPLSFAAENDSPEAIKLLLAARANPNGGAFDAPLLRAIDKHDLACAELLLQAGADPNIEFTWGSKLHANLSAIERTATPLWLAIETHQLPMVQLLLKYKANPDDCQPGNSPLIFWALSDPDILQALLDSGADPNVRNGGGITPLILVEDVLSGNLNVDPLISQPTKADSQFDGDLLRQHGALEWLPDWDHITVSRPATKYSAPIFERGTNDWNQFTLYDLLGVQYTLLSASVRPDWSQDSWTYNLDPVTNSLAFPDFSRIVIHRPPDSGTNWTDIKVDIAHALDSGDGTADVPLKFGDVVEIPESDHVLNALWTGLTTNQLLTLAHCLTRHLQISVNGMTRNFTVGPDVEVGGAWHSQFNSYSVPGLVTLTLQGFMLWPALEDSQLLLSSSDLSHVLVKRHDAVTGQIHEWTLNCSDANSAPNFWLRDGDEIDVPGEKSDYRTSGL
ncbi:MAG TPA: ankyrin repeat domain-containing protein [Alphaproteobacteria bacterium]|nr:ankyrin repeat domain-containing protein [Alphaproteobacteria bacterium]